MSLTRPGEAVSCGFVVTDFRGRTVALNHWTAEYHQRKRELTDDEMALVREAVEHPAFVVDTQSPRGVFFYGSVMPEENLYGGNRLQVIVHYKAAPGGLSAGVVATFWFTDEVQQGRVVYGTGPSPWP